MDRGFSLVEVLVATVVIATGLIGLAQLTITAVRVNQQARSMTIAALLASQKIEQLQALTWAFDDVGASLSDSSTNTTTNPEQSTGGTGLAPSPFDALVRNVNGYCEFLNASGQTLGGGTVPPAGSVFVRRWSVEPLTNPDVLMIQAAATSIGTPQSSSVARRHAEEARIIAVKARKAG
jgi:type IV pilus modification protein PilV